MNKPFMIIAIGALALLLPSLMIASHVDWDWSGSVHATGANWQLRASSRVSGGIWRCSVVTPRVDVGATCEPWKYVHNWLPATPGFSLQVTVK